MEYQVELLKAVVTKAEINVNIQNTQGFRIEQSGHNTVFEPKDGSDPTILIRNASTMKDPAGTELFISMSTDFIFKFDPIPEDRTAAAAQYCQKLIHDKTVDLAVSILHSMGHSLTIGK